MFGDVIEKEWLYEVSVKLHQCKDWYDTVTDPKVTNNVVEVPVAAVAKFIEKPCKENDAPFSYYPRNGKGFCGISALNSAFCHRYDTNRASLIHL